MELTIDSILRKEFLSLGGAICIFTSSLWPQYEGWIERLEFGDWERLLFMVIPVRNYEKGNCCLDIGMEMKGQCSRQSKGNIASNG